MVTAVTALCRKSGYAVLSVGGNYGGKAVRFGAKNWRDSNYPTFAYACEKSIPPRAGYYLTVNGFVGDSALASESRTVVPFESGL